MAVAGPLGFVAGSYLGSKSAKSIVAGDASEYTSKSPQGNQQNDHSHQGQQSQQSQRVLPKSYQQAQVQGPTPPPYQQAETQQNSKNDGYKFGDFTRGLFK